MNVKYTLRALEQVHERAIWWIQNRPKNPWLFDDELNEAETYLRQAPEGPKVHLIRNGIEIRRYLLAGTRHHVYYHFESSTQTVHIVAVHGGPQHDEPDLDL